MRVGAGESRCARRSQPSAQRAANAHGAESTPLRVASSSKRRQQHLLDRAIERAQRQGGLDREVGSLELERAQRPDERVGVGRERLTRAADRGGDRQALLERVPERRDLAVDVQPVLARRPLRPRVAEAPLPCAERVRADVQKGCRFAGFQSPHVVAGE